MGLMTDTGQAQAKLKEVVSAPKAGADKLTAAMVRAAREGDRDMAWQAASRLATVLKNGQ